MTRFIIVLCFLFLVIPVDAKAGSYDSSMPPPRELLSLAEQLTPLIRERPALPPMGSGKKRGVSAESAYDDNEDETRESVRPPSALEQNFSERAGQKLTLFGHEQIGRHVNTMQPTGDIQDDVVLGAGDRVAITFRGQRDDSKTYGIDSQGQLIIAGMEPIAAAGLTLGALRSQIEAETARNLLNTTVFVSVKSLRQVTVTLMGEVGKPGVYTLSPFHTVLDALGMAGGINPNGSLRDVRLIREGKKATLDFYQLLLEGDLSAPVTLRNGDKILVPLLGQTIAVSGDVKRPGIFERAQGRADFTFQEILQLAGGVGQPGANRFVRLSMTPQGDEVVQGLSEKPIATTRFMDGDVLLVTSGQALRTNGVTYPWPCAPAGAARCKEYAGS